MICNVVNIASLKYCCIVIFGVVFFWRNYQAKIHFPLNSFNNLHDIPEMMLFLFLTKWCYEIVKILSARRNATAVCAVVVCPSVCPSQVGVLSKLLDESSWVLTWRLSSSSVETTGRIKLGLDMEAFFQTVKKVKFSHTRYRALGPELIPLYRQSARR